MQKALLYALLTPHDKLRKLQDNSEFTELMVMQEEIKDLPLGVVWNEYLKREGLTESYLPEIKTYEKQILKERN